MDRARVAVAEFLIKSDRSEKVKSVDVLGGTSEDELGTGERDSLSSVAAGIGINGSSSGSNPAAAGSSCR